MKAVAHSHLLLLQVKHAMTATEKILANASEKTKLTLERMCG